MARAIEGSFVVLERRQSLRWAASTAAAFGAIAILLTHWRAMAPGIATVGVYFLLAGVLARRSQARTNFMAQRRQRQVRVTAEGVFVDGVLGVPRNAIVDGYFQPRSGHDPGSTLRLVDKRKRILFESEVDEARSREILHVLGLDVSSRLAGFDGAPPVYATSGRNVGFVAGAMCLMFAGLVWKALLPVIPFAILALVVGGMTPSRIAVGVDGVLVTWLWRKRFLPMAQIVTASAEGKRTIHLHLASGATETLYTSMARSRNAFAEEHRDAVLARIREALVVHRSGAPTADVAVLVGRGTRPSVEWLATLARLRGARGYRETAIRDDDLWRVVEDPTAPEDARAGAAMVLRTSLDDPGRTRIRVAAEATASPKLRIALDAAAAESDEAANEALEALADGGETRTNLRPSSAG